MELVLQAAVVVALGTERNVQGNVGVGELGGTLVAAPALAVGLHAVEVEGEPARLGVAIEQVAVVR